MSKPRSCAAVFALGLILAACAGAPKKPVVDPFPLRFPLVEAGSIDVDGHIVGQPRIRDGILYYGTEGYHTAVVVSSRSVLWRRPVAGAGLAAAGPVGPSVKTAGPALRVEGSMLRALSADGQPIWEFDAKGAIVAEPAVRDGRVYFGTAARVFYCLSASTGKKAWSRRLQGAALHQAVVQDGIVVVAASNSVVYRLSAKGGSILSWETVPSRVLYELAPAASSVLISSASPDIVALDVKTGQRAGQYNAAGVSAAGALWSSPFIVLFEESSESGRQRIVFLRSR
jgi:outer membrane protein assembly factor BamB